MIIEQRTYRLRPGAMAAYLEAVETLGLPLLKPILGGFVGYFRSELGPLEDVVHLWAYESLADRAARRKRLAEHPDWPRFTAAVNPLLERMESRILTPASFTPLTLEAVRALGNVTMTPRAPF